MGKKQRTSKPTEDSKRDFPRKAIPLEIDKNEAETCRNHAQIITSPEVATYRVIQACESQALIDEIDVPSLIEVLRNQSMAANNNDLSQAEGMLTNQAVSLQGLFVRMIEKAFQQNHPPHFEVLMKLALKAQSQSRATIETLSAIKNPPTVFAQQANIAHGHQQVNNDNLSASHARENQKQQNELLRDSNEAVDSRRATTAIATNQELATLGAINRCNNLTR